ncbi:MAG: MDR family MFS transporter [Thermomicrobiales bacterium]
MSATTARPNGQATIGSFHELDRRQLIWTVAGVLLGLLLSSLDQTIVGTALPKIIADLHGFNHYSWVVTAYLLTSTTAVPIFGKLSDIFGRKWIYISGIIVFLFGSILCGAAHSMTQLILFRGLQGIGGGIMAANAFAIIGDIFPPAKRGKWQGITSSVFGLSSVVGPALGGWITDSSSWRWVFYINIPLGIIALAVLVIAFPYFRPTGIKRVIDWAGVATLILAVVPLLLALTWAGGQYRWGSPQVIGLLLFAAAMFAIFALAESRAVEPVLPLELFKNRIFVVGAIVMFVSGLALFGATLYIPLFVQGVIGRSAASSGAILTPFMLSLIVGSTTSGQLISRRGRYKANALVGTAIMIVGMTLLARMGVGTTNSTVIRNMIVTGFGTGLTFPVFTIAVQNAFSITRIGVVTSATQFFRQIGGTLGTAVMGSLLTSHFVNSFNANLPPEVGAAVPPSVLTQLKNPQVLVSAPTQEQLKGVFATAGPGAQTFYSTFVSVVRHALADGIHVVFIISVVGAIIAFACTWFLQEIPLRKSNRIEAAEETATMPAVGQVTSNVPAGPRASTGVVASGQGD